MKILTQEEFMALADCVQEAIREDYQKIEETYHWKERRFYFKKKSFAKFSGDSTVGFAETLAFRKKANKLWNAICQAKTLNFKISRKEYRSLMPNDIKDDLCNSQYELLISDPKIWFANIVIKNWGGIQRNDKETITTFCNAFCELQTKVHSNALNIYKTQSYSSFTDGVSSWSKLLAFADPHNFVIYDSRVAYKLNSIILENLDSKLSFMKNSPFALGEEDVTGWYKKCLTMRLMNNFEIVNEQAKNSKKKLSSEDKKDSYCQYLRLVEELSNRFLLTDKTAEGVLDVKQKIEMTLFTTGRIIEKDYFKQYYEELKNPESPEVFNVWEKKNSNDPFKTGYEELVERLIKDLNEKI